MPHTRKPQICSEPGISKQGHGYLHTAAWAACLREKRFPLQPSARALPCERVGWPGAKQVDLGVLKLALQCQDASLACQCPIIGPGCLFIGGVPGAASNAWVGQGAPRFHKQLTGAGGRLCCLQSAAPLAACAWEARGTAFLDAVCWIWCFWLFVLGPSLPVVGRISCLYSLQ